MSPWRQPANLWHFSDQRRWLFHSRLRGDDRQPGSTAGAPATSAPASICSNSSRLIAVGGGHQFRMISAGDCYTCGVTTDNRAFCWGRNRDGQLGDGTKTERLSPVPVADGSTIPSHERELSPTPAGYPPTNRVYCWGYNGRGLLGDGTEINRLTPVEIAGATGITRSQSASVMPVPGVPRHESGAGEATNTAGCGNNSTAKYSTVPVEIPGGRSYRQVSAGSHHSCAVTVTKIGFCWGEGRYGQIGDGNPHQRWTPRMVAGNLSLERVSAGTTHTCAETTGNRAYCWGNNGLWRSG